VSPHLGDEVAAFVDGQLGYARQERALGHLSGCAACRAAVEQQRRVKARVQTLPGAEPSAALLSTLTRVPGAAVRSDPPAFGPASPWPPTHAWVTPQSRTARGGLLLAGVGTVAAGVLGLAYVVGAATVRDPGAVSPPVGRFHAEFAGADQPVPLYDPAMDAFPVLDGRLPMGGR
jgi:anti-sigma factor RsiW